MKPSPVRVAHRHLEALQYRGKLPVADVAGRYREFLLPRDIPGVRYPFHGRNSPSLNATKPASDPNQAERDGAADAKNYQHSTWPGGSAEVVALVHWTDLDRWSAVVNTYYSFS